MKTNYQKILDNTLADISKNGKTPVLLLHVCCAPCSSYVLEYLTEFFNIVIFFYNPNISPNEEYIYRLNEVKRLVRELPLKNSVTIIEGDYSPEVFFSLAKGLENERERGLRCQKCIAHRLEIAADMAKKIGADFFTTTLTISPHKDSEFINSAGGEIAEKVGIPYLFSDFKKREGYKRSIQLSAEYNLYRQNFCGCVYSKMANAERQA